jgi:hypothetical protein
MRYDNDTKGRYAMNKLVQAAYEDSQGVIQWLQKNCKQKVSLELFDDEDQKGILIDGWISIRLCEMEVKTIARKETTDGLMVEVTTVQNNYPHEPDDVYIVEILSTQSVDQAVHKAFNIWFDNILDRLLEGIGHEKWLAEEAAMYKEMDEATKMMGGDS